MQVNPQHLAVDFDEAILKIDKTLLDINKELRDMDGMSVSAKEKKAYADAVGYFDSLRKFLSHEKNSLERVREITGFQLVVAAYVKVGDGLAPCPLLLENK